MFNLANSLEEAGHEVAYFAMHNERNIDSPWSKYFIDEIDFKSAHKKQTMKNVCAVLGRSIYSFKSKRFIERLIIGYDPDIAWFQTIHNHISPSIIHTLRKYDVPIIWTLHTYTAICLNSTLLCDGELCEECKPNKYYKAVLRHCKKDSLTASAVGTIASYIHKSLRLYHLVDRYISPSKFLRRKFIEFGFPPDKISHIPNLIYADRIVPQFGGQYGLYFGRLAPEKGIKTLLKSLKQNADIPFKIAGDGVSAEALKTFARQNGIKNIEFTGFKTGTELAELVRASKFVVVPSEWYENLPYSVMEAFAFGKPVIATNIGGISEMIDDGRNGLLFEYRNHSQLSERLRVLFKDGELCKKIGREARKDAEVRYNPKIHYKQISTLISKLI